MLCAVFFSLSVQGIRDSVFLITVAESAGQPLVSLPSSGGAGLLYFMTQITGRLWAIFI